MSFLFLFLIFSLFLLLFLPLFPPLSSLILSLLPFLLSSCSLILNFFFSSSSPSFFLFLLFLPPLYSSLLSPFFTFLFSSFLFISPFLLSLHSSFLPPGNVTVNAWAPFVERWGREKHWHGNWGSGEVCAELCMFVCMFVYLDPPLNYLKLRRFKHLVKFNIHVQLQQWCYDMKETMSFFEVTCWLTHVYLAACLWFLYNTWRMDYDRQAGCSGLVTRAMQKQEARLPLLIHSRDLIPILQFE